MVALKRSNRYIQLGLQERFELWFPLTFRPHVLMWPLYPYRATNINEDTEARRYERWQSFKGFYYKFGTLFQGHASTTDFRETTRKFNAGGPTSS